MNRTASQRLDRADIAGRLDECLNNVYLPRLTGGYDRIAREQEEGQEKEELNMLLELEEAAGCGTLPRKPPPMKTLAELADRMTDFRHRENPIYKQNNRLAGEKKTGDAEFLKTQTAADIDGTRYRQQIEQALYGRRLPPPRLPRPSVLRFLAVNIIHVVAYPFSILRMLFRGDARRDYREEMMELRRQLREYKSR